VNHHPLLSMSLTSVGSFLRGVHQWHTSSSTDAMKGEVRSVDQRATSSWLEYPWKVANLLRYRAVSAMLQLRFNT